MAGPSSQISFLLDYKGSARSLQANSLNLVPLAIIKALDETFDRDFSLKYLCASTDEDPEPVAVDGEFIIKKWSTEYNRYVDVVSLLEIRGGDQLTIAPRPRADSKAEVCPLMLKSFLI